MSTEKQRRAARRNIKAAAAAAKQKRTISRMPKATGTALGKQASAVARRRRTHTSQPKTKAELYEMAKRRNIPGRSRMGRDELMRALRRR